MKNNYEYVIKAFRDSVRYQYVLWFRFHRYESSSAYMEKIIHEKYIYFSGWLAGVRSCGNDISVFEKKLKLEKYRLYNAYQEFQIYKKDFIKTMVVR